MSTDAERIAELEEKVAVLIELVCACGERSHLATAYTSRRREVERQARALFDKGFQITGRWSYRSLEAVAA